jgi:GNAT superfamily N-acetyltransferase
MALTEAIGQTGLVEHEPSVALRRVVDTTARSLAAIALELSRLRPGHPAEATRVAGGWLVLTGPGSYVNRLVGGGIERPLTDDDLATVVERSVAVGVEPAVDVTGATDSAGIEVLRSSGFDPPTTTVTIMRWDGERPVATDDVRVRLIEVDEVDEIDEWKSLTARGWGHADPAARHISDEFTEAIASIEGEHLLIASSRFDGRALGCAGLSIRDGMATLGGMSTLPDERGHGVQTTLVAARLELAIDHGCDLIVATAATGGASERNLRRLGFEPLSPLRTYQRPVRT